MCCAGVLVYSPTVRWSVLGLTLALALFWWGSQRRWHRYLLVPRCPACGWPLGHVTHHHYRYEWVNRAIYWTDHVQADVTDYACRHCQHTWRVDRSKVVYSENHAM